MKASCIWPWHWTCTHAPSLVGRVGAHGGHATQYSDPLKESFDQLWDYQSAAWARKLFGNWKAQLKWPRRLLHA